MCVCVCVCVAVGDWWRVLAAGCSGSLVSHSLWQPTVLRWQVSTFQESTKEQVAREGKKCDVYSVEHERSYFFRPGDMDGCIFIRIMFPVLIAQCKVRWLLRFFFFLLYTFLFKGSRVTWQVLLRGFSSERGVSWILSVNGVILTAVVLS